MSDVPTEHDPLIEARRRILAAALPNVPFDGWNNRLLTDAAVQAGFQASMAARAFPGGVADLLDFYMAEADRLMLAALAAEAAGPPAKIRERIARAIRLRLEQQVAHREAVRRALSELALPHRAPLAAKGLYRTIDAIWYAAGDEATDFNFYTKRALLAAVYAATLAYWLDDKSEGQAQTWAFLDRRISDIMQIQKLRGRLRGLTYRLPRPGRLFRHRA